MSKNIHISAFAEVDLKLMHKPSFKKIDRIYFDAISTPTEISEKIVNDSNPIESYCNWVIEQNFTDEYDVYSPEDIWEVNPIGTKEVNVSLQHVQELRDWVESMKENGYQVEVEAW